MESKVQLSKFSYNLTLIINVILIGCCVSMFDEKQEFWIVLGILLMLLCFGFLYGPRQIIADSDYIIVKTYLLKHKILVSDIESVELFRPTMGSIRLLASGGYCGYWGIFRDGLIGTYAGYYGKSSDCFLVRMKNGGKYVLGCENPEEMVNFINSKIQS